jgi:hypothetical protein
VGVAVASLALGLAALGLLGAVSWRRTAPARGGGVPEAEGLSGASALPGAPRRTSPVTFVPAAIGTAWVAGALAGAVPDLLRGRSPPTGTLAIGGIGLGVAVSGVAARVTELHVEPGRFLVRHRLRPAFVTSWDRVARLVPPRWFLGGWAVWLEPGASPAVCRLMPSDLWGHETILSMVIGRAGLSRRGRGWARATSGPADRSDPPT